MKPRLKLLTVALAAAMGSAVTAQAGEACSARNFTNTETSVISAYIAYYGRVPDAAGLAYWAEEIKRQNGSLQSIIEAFGNAPEYTETYGGLSNEDLVNSLYQQAFGRNADQAGLDFYVGQLESGAMTPQQIALDIINGATGADAVVLENRIMVARHYVTEVESAGKEIDLADMKSTLATVGYPEYEADQACTTYDALVAEAAQDTTGLACDNGGKGEPVKKVGQLTGVAGLSYYSQSKASLGGIKKTVQGETSATGQFEYYEACGESATITFCTGVKKNCSASEFATGVDTVLPLGQRVIGMITPSQFPGEANGITLRDVIDNSYPDTGSNTRDFILTNVNQLLIGLDSDANETDGVELDDITRESLDLVADNIDFTFSNFDNDPNVLNLVTTRGRTLPSDERAQIFQKVTEYKNETTTPFDSASVDDFLVLEPNAQPVNGGLFVGFDIGSFAGPQDLLTSESIDNNSFQMKRFLSNYYANGSVTSVATELVTATFSTKTADPDPVMSTTPSPITNKAGVADKGSLVDGSTTYSTTWKYYTDNNNWQLDLYAFGSSYTGSFPAADDTSNDLDQIDSRWEIRSLQSAPKAFPEANAEIRIYDADGNLKSKHLVKLEVSGS